MSAEPPVPCPPGFVWDGKRFYKLPPHLAKVTESTHDGQSPRFDKRDRASRQPKSRASSSARDHDLPLPEGSAVPSSAFNFTPARPPAYFQGTQNWARHMPRDLPSSFAGSSRWIRAQIQNHVASLRFFSRDVIKIEEVDGGYRRPILACSVSGMRSPEASGSLLWLTTFQRSSESLNLGLIQNHCDTFLSSVSLDTAGRRSGTERRVTNFDRTLPGTAYQYTHWDPNLFHISPSSQADVGLPPVTTNTGHSDYAPVINVPLDIPAADPGREEALRFQVLYVADPSSRSLRGFHPREPLEGPNLAAAVTAVRDEEGLYHVPNHQLSATVSMKRPINRILPLGPSSTEPLTRAPGQVHLWVSSPGDQGPTLRAVAVKSIYWAHECDLPKENQSFSAATVCNVSGLCWLGYHNGMIAVIDTVAVLLDSTIRLREHESRFRHGEIPRYSPKPTWYGHKMTHGQFRDRGALTNLLPLNEREVIALFSSGDILRLARCESSGRVHTVAEFSGHVNEGTTEVLACLHPPSHLFAARGTDKVVRIWHLDEPRPLNSLWHQPQFGKGEQDLMPAPKSLHERLLSRRQQGSASAGAPDDESWRRLVFGALSSPETRLAAKQPLRHHHVMSRTMCFTPTAWVANRDAQWELTRDFTADDHPKVLESGLLPGITFALADADVPRVVYFEPPKRETEATSPRRDVPSGPSTSSKRKLDAKRRKRRHER